MIQCEAVCDLVTKKVSTADRVLLQMFFIHKKKCPQQNSVVFRFSFCAPTEQSEQKIDPIHFSGEKEIIIIQYFPLCLSTVHMAGSNVIIIQLEADKHRTNTEGNLPSKPSERWSSVRAVEAAESICWCLAADANSHLHTPPPLVKLSLLYAANLSVDREEQNAALSPQELISFHPPVRRLSGSAASAQQPQFSAQFCYIIVSSAFL